jgi:hypothetical protein
VKKIVSLAFFAGIILICADAQEKPAWVDTPSAVYPQRLYVSAVGSGRDRRSAETAAFSALTSYFKQSISTEINIKDTERQANGRSDSESQMSQTIAAVSALDSLIGAEIKSAWNDAKNKSWFAAAVMEKAKCARLYAGELDKAINEINALIDISDGVSFETISRCQKAEVTLGKADVNALLLSMLDGPNRQAEISQLGDRIRAVRDAAKSIPVDVRVKGDVNGRLKAAFAKIFTAAGFRTGERNSRFVLEVALTMEPVTLGRYFNTRYTVNAVLKDTRTESDLFTYSAANREAHPASQTEADNRAVIGAERKIEEEFPEALQEYLESN